MSVPANKSANARLASRLFAGCHPGLPPKVTRMPFGLESRTKELLGLTASQLQVVVAVIAAAFVQLGPVTQQQLNAVVDCHAGAHLYGLVLAGWLDEGEKVKGSRAKQYVPTAKAWRELGLQGWSLLKEVA